MTFSSAQVPPSGMGHLEKCGWGWVNFSGSLPSMFFFGCSSYWEEIGLKMDLKSMIYSFTFKYEQCCESEINNSNSPNTRSNEIATRPWHRRAIGEVEYPNFQKQQFFDLICQICPVVWTIHIENLCENNFPPNSEAYSCHLSLEKASYSDITFEMIIVLSENSENRVQYSTPFHAIVGHHCHRLSHFTGMPHCQTNPSSEHYRRRVKNWGSSAVTSWNPPREVQWFASWIHVILWMVAKSCTSWLLVYPILYKLSIIQGSAGFLPSTVWPKKCA